MLNYRKCVIRVVCVKLGNGMQSKTTMSHKLYLMAILDNYMFRPLLALFRLTIVYSRNLSSLEDNLKMASKGRNI